MILKANKFLGIIICFFYVLLSGCNQKVQPDVSLFSVLSADQTGLNFINKLTPTEEFNMFHYMYFYNGAGVGAGDFNNDGKIDLFFSSNQGDNKIYLNEGALHFKDVTDSSELPQDHGWSTGVSIVDINNDGLLDIYICKVGKYEILHSKNQLLICTGIDKNGIPHYQDQAARYGLDFSGFSTQAVFFDYDGDGDLDMFLLNHSVHQNGNFAPRKEFLGTYDLLSGDRLYRNDGNEHFTEVTRDSKINSSAISYGLGVAVSDINLDGSPDLYVSNDFHENDYLYINQKDGTFADENSKSLMHTAQFSMGVDVADINNDGFPEIISMDMLPEDPYILKRSLGEDDYDVFYHKISVGYNYQYTRNNLQFNRRNGTFSETGLYSGVAATDWSWAPLWMDFDNDGLKDLFISNGIPKRMNDMDYVNFVSNQEIQQKLRENKMNEKDMALVNKFPEIKIPNKFFSNKGDLVFEDIKNKIGNNEPTYSNGAVYADFDNDGDLDVVVNNIDDKALLYQNKSKSSGNYAEIILHGSKKNINALGAKVILFANGGIRAYENFPCKGFLSSMQTPIHIGLQNTKVDSAFLIWPDNTFQRIGFNKGINKLTFSYSTGLPVFNYNTITTYSKNETRPMVNVTASTGLDYLHEENPFDEFDREPLMPHMVSTEGPALAVADINHDGLDDVFIGASKTFHNAVFLQQPNGKFIKTVQPEMMKDSMYEDVDAKWIDVNNDGNPDLVIANGGNEYYGNDEHLLPRVYLNDGRAHFTKLDNAFTNLYETFSCVVPNDFNGDGKQDLFLGGRAIPWQYGKIPQSYLLQNDGTGRFIDVTKKYAEELLNEGMVTHAVWVDINKDGHKDLIVCSEWGGIDAFIYTNGQFKKRVLTDKKGWWNFLLPVDINHDGNIDFIAGNMGTNSRLKASEEQPVRLYYNDFDDNGKQEQVLSYYVQNKEVPFANKDELQKQIPILKKKFLYAGDFAKATMEEIFGSGKLESSSVLTANYFSNALLINQGNLQFELKALPWQAQLSTLRDAAVIDANNDGMPDVLLVGNYYENNIQLGRYDADFGTLLINKAGKTLACENINGLSVKGQVRHICKIRIGNMDSYILARNSDSTMIIQFAGK